jgi:hypothetical protein
MPRWGRLLRALEVCCVVGALVCGWALRLRLAERDWMYAGADSYVYVGAAADLYDKREYTLRAPPWLNPSGESGGLSYCRPPGYPLFVAAVARPKLAPRYESYLPVFRRVLSAQRALDLLTCLLGYLLARSAAGRGAAWASLLLLVGSPFLALFTASIMTETLATTLTTLTVCLVWAASRRPSEKTFGESPMSASRGRAARTARLQQHLPSLALVCAGMTAAMGALVRADGWLLVPILALPVLVGAASLRVTGLALSLFALVYLPWPIRNEVQFGAPHPLGALCDTLGAPLQRTGFYDWVATWLEHEGQLPRSVYCFFKPQCRLEVANFPPEAFDSKEELEAIRLLFERYNREGLTETVDAQFRERASHRMEMRWMERRILLPLRRARQLWVRPPDQPLRHRPRPPWPEVMVPLQAAFERLTLGALAGGALGLLALLRRRGDGRRAALLLGGALALRTAALAYFGFVEARYVLELYPVVLVLCGVGLASLLPRRCRVRTP